MRNKIKNQKIIFLDVDGVLNIISDSYRTMAWTNYGNDAVEPHLMKRLEYLLEKVPDANIVISSAWSEIQLTDVLEKLRFKFMNKIIGRTPRRLRYRGQQINSWLLNNNWSKYVVLEDEISDVCGDKCSLIPKEFVIQVDMKEGLSNKNIEKAIQILK